MADRQREIFSEEDFSIFGDVAEMGMVEDTDKEIEDTTVEKDVIDDVDFDADQNVDTEDEDNNDLEEDYDKLNDQDEDEESSEDQDSDEDEDKSSLFTPYAKLLVENDILSTLDIENFDGTLESLLEAQRNEVTHHVDKYKEALPSEVKRLINGYEAGIPFDEMLKISSDRIRYGNIKDDELELNVDLQKNVIKEFFKKTTKFNEDRINKTIERLENNGELEDESKLSLVELREIQDLEENEAISRTKKEQEEFVQRQNKIMEDLKTTINTTEEIIPGIKVSKIMKDKIQKNLTTAVAYDEYNQPLNKVGLYSKNDPIGFDIMLNYIFEATSEFKDWSVFAKGGKSKAIKELENAAKSLDREDSVSVKRKKSPEGLQGMFSAIERMSK